MAIAALKSPLGLLKILITVSELTTKKVSWRKIVADSFKCSKFLARKSCRIGFCEKVFVPPRQKEKVFFASRCPFFPFRHDRVEFTAPNHTLDSREKTIEPLRFNLFYLFPSLRRRRLRRVKLKHQFGKL